MFAQMKFLPFPTYPSKTILFDATVSILPKEKNVAVLTQKESVDNFFKKRFSFDGERDISSPCQL